MRERKENGVRVGAVLGHREMGRSEEAGSGAGGNGPPAAERDWSRAKNRGRRGKIKNSFSIFSNTISNPI